MRAGLRISKPQMADWLRKELQRGVLCRAALARGLCEQGERCNPRGPLCAASAQKGPSRDGGNRSLGVDPGKLWLRKSAK